MNKVLLILNAALVGLTIVLAWKLISRTTTSGTPDAVVAVTNAQPPSPPPQVTSVEQSNLLHASCRSQLAMMSGVLSNTMNQLASAQQRIQDLEAASVPVTNAPPAAPAPAPRIASAQGARPVPRSYFFEKVLAANGEVLGQDMEFTGVYGRRVAFKETNSTRRVAFDVDQLDPSVLETLAIDAAEQKALKARQDRVWKQLENASLAAEQAEAQKRQERKAAEQAAWAEEQRRQGEERERQEALDRANQAPPMAYPPAGYYAPGYVPPTQPMQPEPPR